MPSGKQILLKTLQEVSQKKQEKSSLLEITEKIKCALMLHCSTSGSSIKQIEKLAWLSKNEGPKVEKQGLGLKHNGIFLSDLFEELISPEKVPENIKVRFPDLAEKDYFDGLDIIWSLLSSLQYWDELSTVENKGVLDEEEADKLLNATSEHLVTYRNEPW